MRETIRFTIEEARPGTSDILESQGMPDRSDLPERIGTVLDEAMLLFAELADPRGIMADVPKADFEVIYRGEGLNYPETPLEGIIPRSDRLALFAATLGKPISVRISELFAGNELALGFMLDAVASAGADQLATIMGRRFLELLPAEGSTAGDTRVLPYSPGYCGWHITAQARLFEFLHPEDIGITLNSSYLMQPLKSVSGVLVAGKGEIHKFRPKFSFCADCKTHQCVERMASVLRS
jgi:hypothetical protein